MSATPGFFEALAAQCKAKDSYLCVGLDPRTVSYTHLTLPTILLV